jgi:hypothetical protein
MDINLKKDFENDLDYLCRARRYKKYIIEKIGRIVDQAEYEGFKRGYKEFEMNRKAMKILNKKD